MSDYFSKLKTIKNESPPRLLIYGPPGQGKTTLTGEFLSAFHVLVESGLPKSMEVDGDEPKTYEAVLDIIRELYNGDHDFKTIIIDTLDKLEPLIWDAACRQNNWANIEAPGYGKGYVATGYLWREFLDGLNMLRIDRNMTVVMVAHSDVERFDDPRTASYSRYEVRLHKSGRKLVEDEVDAILLINQEPNVKEEDQGFNKKRAHAEGSDQRFIYCQGRPAYTAKNRYGMPAKIPYRIGRGYAELAEYLPGQPAAK